MWPFSFKEQIKIVNKVKDDGCMYLKHVQGSEVEFPYPQTAQIVVNRIQ